MSETPPAGTVERWAWDYLSSNDLAYKLAPPAPPREWEAGPPRRVEAPGRPQELRIAARGTKTPGPEALRAPEKRAALVHTFLHHELQAAELFAWAILAFPDAPAAFRAGLLTVALDEIRHMAMYAEHLEALGSRVGAFPVRDWFWERVPRATSPAHFAAAMGVGFEGANLDHTARFAERFRAVGDEVGARIQERVGEEEIPHVRFALHWLGRLAGKAPGEVSFADWTARLPPPLSPTVMRGVPLNREARRRAGLSDAFVEELSAWIFDPHAPGP